MLLSEQFIDGDGDTFHIKKTYDATPVLERVAQMRSADAGKFGESRFVGSVPGWLINEWCKEAGIDFSDNEARREVMRKKLMSGDFSALRVWEGNF